MKTVLFVDGTLFIGTNKGKVIAVGTVSSVFECDETAGSVLALCVVIDGVQRFLFATFENKLVYCWNIAENRLISSGAARKKVTAMVPATVEHPSGQKLVILASDKAGDVWAFDGVSLGNKINIAGHTASVIADMIRLPCGSVVTCDRDEKIRISQFPHMEVVKGYCLGHTSVVTSVANIVLEANGNSRQVLVSCGWDRKLIVWDLSTFAIIAELVCSPTTEASRQEAVETEDSHDVDEIAAGSADASAEDVRGEEEEENDDFEKTYDESANGSFPVKIVYLPNSTVFCVIFRNSTELQLFDISLDAKAASGVRVSGPSVHQLPRVPVDAALLPATSSDSSASIALLFDNEVEIKVLDIAPGPQSGSADSLILTDRSDWAAHCTQLAIIAKHHGVSYPMVSAFSVDGEADPDKGMRKHALDRPFNKETDIAKHRGAKRSAKKRKAADEAEIL